MKKRIFTSFVGMLAAAIILTAVLLTLLTYRLYIAHAQQEEMSLLSVYMRALPLTALLLLSMIGACALVAQKLTERLIAPIVRLTESLGDADADTEYPELTPVIRRIRSQHEEILRSANMRVEFTANVSHELKTPLTSISGYAELIENGMATDGMEREFARKIHKSASRLLTLINDIIRLSQMDAPEYQMEWENVDLAQTAESVLEQMKLNAQQMNVDLQMDGRTAMVSADRQMMEELIYNLCDNAIRYNVYGGSVNIQVHPVRDHVRLVVQDTGIGISEENKERVFERFYRVDKSRSKATGGTGLGLAIVKHIAAKHGAQIEMESELGRGTRITVTFKRAGK